MAVEPQKIHTGRITSIEKKKRKGQEPQLTQRGPVEPPNLLASHGIGSEYGQPKAVAKSEEIEWGEEFPGADVVSLFVGRPDLEHVENQMIPALKSDNTYEVTGTISKAFVRKDVPMLGAELEGWARELVDQRTKGEKIWYGEYAIVFPIKRGGTRLALVEEGYFVGPNIRRYIPRKEKAA